MRRTSTTLFWIGLLFMLTNGEEISPDCNTLCKCRWVSGKITADCSKQNLTRIPAQLPADIQSLDLTGNHITQLLGKAFNGVGLVNLHKLILRDCGIRAIHIDAFNGLTIVIELDLSNNHIKNILPGTFSETQKLRVLQLNHNLLEGLDDNLFSDLEFLQKIELSNNRLMRIAEKTFRNLPLFFSLTLDGNELTTLELRTFENLSSLNSLELNNNPWNCDCHLKRFRNWAIKRNLYTKPTNCSLPPNLFGKLWIEIDSNDFACQPKILSIGPNTNTELEHGGSVTLWCHAAGVPQPQINWIHRSKILTNSTRRHTPDRSYSLTSQHEWLNLTIADVIAVDKGEFICAASSPGGRVEKTISLSIIGDSEGGGNGLISHPLALGLGVTLLLLFLFLLTLCTWFYQRRRVRHDEKNAEVTSLEHHGLGEQEKSLITAINPVVKPPRRYEAPSVTSHGTEMTELNRTLLDNDSVFADGPESLVGIIGAINEDEREHGTPEPETGNSIHGTSYRHYPPDLLAFSGGRGSSPSSQSSMVPDGTGTPRLTSHQPGFASPISSAGQYPASFKTLPHNRSSNASYSLPSSMVSPRQGYVTIPRRARAPSWSSGPPTSPVEAVEPVYDNLGLRTTADGSSVLSLNKSPEPGFSSMRMRPLPVTPVHHYNTIQRSTPNILSESPIDRSAPEGAAEWFNKLEDLENRSMSEAGTLGRKVPPRPPPKPKKKSSNGPLYEDEGEDGTEV